MQYLRRAVSSWADHGLSDWLLLCSLAQMWCPVIEYEHWLSRTHLQLEEQAVARWLRSRLRGPVKALAILLRLLIGKNHGGRKIVPWFRFRARCTKTISAPKSSDSGIYTVRQLVRFARRLSSVAGWLYLLVRGYEPQRRDRCTR